MTTQNKENDAPAVSSIGACAAHRRRSLGLRQDELADLADVSIRFIHSLEHDKPTVRLDKVVAVLEVLGLELDVRLRS